MNNKSVFDGVKQLNKAFPNLPDYEKPNDKKLTYGKVDESVQEQFEIVSQCLQCGSPIYGRKTVSVDSFPVVVRSCRCLNKVSLLDQMEVK